MWTLLSLSLSSYPAGFVYIYSLLYVVTEKGQDIVLAQHIFALLYLINLAVVFRLYSRLAKVLSHSLN